MTAPVPNLATTRKELMGAEQRACTGLLFGKGRLFTEPPAGERRLELKRWSTSGAR
jgi:hypothetical protein